MWFWSGWKLWVKLLLSIPVILVTIGLISAFGLAATLPERSEENDKKRVKDLETVNQAIKQEITTSGGKISLCGKEQSPCYYYSAEKDYDTKKSDGTGWVKVKLSSLSELPTDPLNTEDFNYYYCSDGKDWEVETWFQSKKSEFIQRAKNDGGNNPDAYELGSNLNVCVYSE